MRWTWTLLVIGLVIGLIIGLEQASAVKETVLGGGSGRLVLQRDIVSMYIGWGAGIGAVIGIVIDLIRGGRRPYTLNSLRVGGYRRNMSVTDQEKAQILEEMATNRRARSEAIAAGMTPEQYDQRQAELIAQQKAAEKSVYWDKIKGLNGD